MARRALPFRPKLPESAADLLTEARTATFYLVQRPGPLSFILRAEGSDVKHRVLIGPYQQCSCGGGNAEDAVNQDCENELCIHILFVMTRVLGVPARSPLVWQLSLVDREVEEVLKYRFPSVMRLSRIEPLVPRRKPLRKRTHEIAQRRLQDDATCAICCEPMTMEKGDLVFCRFGCGNSVHGACMKVWAEHQRSIRKELTCPLCRKEWGPLSWGYTKRFCCETLWRAQGSYHHNNVSCSSCGVGPLVGTRYRCTICETMHLCSRCFEAGVHPEHSFVIRRTLYGDERRVQRPNLTSRNSFRTTAPASTSLFPSNERDGNAQQSDVRPSASLLLHRRTSSRDDAREEPPQPHPIAVTNSERPSTQRRGRRALFQYLKTFFRFRKLRRGGIIARTPAAQTLQR